MSRTNISSELLKRYIAGECTGEEVFLVDEWYASFSQNVEAETAREFNQPQHLEKVLEEIRFQSPEDVEKSTSRPWSLSPIFRYVAAAMLLLATGLAGYYLAFPKRSIFSQDMAAISFQNRTQQVIKHAFPDGSMVWLNPGAKISYSKNAFTAHSREVALDGEAFFEVTHDASRPFLVNSEAVHVRVLGTSFNVRANRGESQFEVSVVTGKVSVTADQGKQITLLPHQQAIFKVASGELTAGEVPRSSDKVPLWQPVSLTFQDAKLGEVVKRLEEKFDVQIRLDNPDLENCRVKATFDNSRLSEILEMTMQIVEADYQMQNDVIVIRGQGCAASE